MMDESDELEAPPFPSGADTDDPLRDHPVRGVSGEVHTPAQVHLELGLYVLSASVRWSQGSAAIGWLVAS